MEILTEHILRQGGALFYRIANADGKVWLVPARNMQVAMNLYQPSGIKGKAFKNVFPCLHKLKRVRKVVKAEPVCCALHEELQTLFCQVFQASELEFSVFCGTPGVHQKITIQLSKGKRILGYCKASENEEVFRLFETEAGTLRHLSKQGVGGIPECLFCGKINGGPGVFVQSTAKTQKSSVVHEWGRLHKLFMTDLRQRTLRKIVFEESDYYRTLQDMQARMDWLPQCLDRALVKRTLQEVADTYRGKWVEYSAYHADFTPWNMFVEKGKLFVFDWEYARLTYPPDLDRYHFFAQTAIFEKHWTAEKMIHYMNSEEGKWIEREMLLLYLLDVMSRFTIREKGNATGAVMPSFNTWNNLLYYLQK